jgi:HK97 family phage major capsid protein
MTPQTAITPTDLRDERGRVLAQVDDIIETARASGQSTLPKAEQAEHDRLVTRAETLNDLIERAEGRPSSVLPANGPGIVRVGHEAGTYRPDDRDHGYFGDLFRSQFLGDMLASERLTRHTQEHGIEVSRDIASTDVASFMPPTYLSEQYVELARAGRPIANACARFPLPPHGQSVVIPRITTGTATAVQTAENAGVQETNMDDTTLTVPVVTIAGQQDISRQLLERGSPEMDQVIFGDLAADYAAKLDAQVIAGTGSSGQMLGITAVSGINAVTYTDASPTVAELWPKIGDAVSQVVSGRYQSASAVFMHPRRWAWMLAALGTDGRPLIAATAGSGPVNALGVGTPNGYGDGTAGTLFGLPVITDANIGTALGAGTEDVIIIGRPSDWHLFENGDGSPQMLRFDAPGAGSLTIKLTVHGFAAFAAGRQPESIATITGTGLAAPAFA